MVRKRKIEGNRPQCMTNFKYFDIRTHITQFIIQTNKYTTHTYTLIIMYEGRSEITASYLFPWKLQQIQRA